MDPIADMLTRIRNALAVKKPEVVLPYSKLKYNLARLLESQGWVEKTENLQEGAKKMLKLILKYDNAGLPAIAGMKRVSKAGQRIYAKASEISKYRLGLGATIISTSKGLMTDREARKEKVGGEVICQIW
ncbi:MAG: 30S ribosomal protein S8 [Candidatus Doudnabacteria bacterium]|nr:30S ribosomal protein S8 [Candidatus Doudnabacteria bacterium]